MTTASFKTTAALAVAQLVTDLKGVAALKRVYSGPPDMIHEWPAAVLFEEWTQERHLSFRKIVMDMHVQLFIVKVGDLSDTLDNVYSVVRDAAFDVMNAMDQDITLAGLAQNSVWGTPMIQIHKLGYGLEEWYGADLRSTHRFEGDYSYS